MLDEMIKQNTLKICNISCYIFSLMNALVYAMLTFIRGENKVAQNDRQKIYVDFLKRFARSFHRAQTSYF